MKSFKKLSIACCALITLLLAPAISNAWGGVVVNTNGPRSVHVQIGHPIYYPGQFRSSESYRYGHRYGVPSYPLRPYGYYHNSPSVIVRPGLRSDPVYIWRR